VRIGLGRDRVGARDRRRPPAREPCVRQVEAVPEEVDRARLAGELRREPPQGGVGDPQDPPEPLDRVRVVAVVQRVLRERRAVTEVERIRNDGGRDADLGQRREEVGVEGRDRQPVPEREPGPAARAGPDLQAVVDEIELDLGGQVAARHGAGGEPARRDVERHVPPVVAEGRERHPDLAQHLAVAVQGLLGRFPLPVGELGPPARARGHPRLRRRLAGRRQSAEPRPASTRAPANASAIRATRSP
jgi:hypothetical protein